jgi:hypothetical protein
MSRARLRARLDRLERLDDTTNRTYGFTIDPVAAKALRDEQARLWELGCKADSPSAYGGPLTSADIAERDRLRESIAARGRSFSCPPSYGALQARDDEKRSRHLSQIRLSPAHGGVPQTAAEDAEEAQVVARLAAYENSPEYHARRRIRDLSTKRGERTPAEETELDDLQKRYPELPFDHNDPVATFARDFSQTCKRILEERAARVAADPSLRRASRQ